MKRVFMFVVVLVCGSNVLADDHNAPNKGQFYISPGLVGYEGPDASSIGHDGLDVGAGVIIGYALSDKWSVEVLGGRVESDFDTIWGSGEDDVDLTWLDFMYKLNPNGGWQPFLLVGGGRSEYSFDGARPDARDNQLNAGIGVFRSLTDRIALRGDIRGVTTTKNGGVSPFAFLGLTGFLGEGSTRMPPPDSDGDGVINDLDKCPTTPPGRLVDADGCEFDGDGDGVVDGDDDCPETPAGVAVNDRGCPLDSDGDGVPDYLDECPDSEAGAKVDAKGCYLELEEEVTIDMNIEFETDKAEIRPDHGSELNRAIKFLREYPTTNAVIEGHTDSVGAASYNQALSERRAKAVYDHLINEAGIRASRLDWAGYGETRPIASNDSADGRQRNRRVTAVVSGTHKVRQ
ncbi:MAG: OmpA family protein [Pseudomonadota bacterium]